MPDVISCLYPAAAAVAAATTNTKYFVFKHFAYKELTLTCLRESWSCLGTSCRRSSVPARAAHISHSETSYRQSTATKHTSAKFISPWLLSSREHKHSEYAFFTGHRRWEPYQRQTAAMHTNQAGWAYHTQTVQKLSVCLCVNHDGPNRNHDMQRKFVILHAIMDTKPGQFLQTIHKHSPIKLPKPTDVSPPTSFIHSASRCIIIHYIRVIYSVLSTTLLNHGVQN